MRTSFLITFICCLIGISQLQAQDKEWTILAYVVGSDIVEDAITDLGEMRAAGATDNLNIVTLQGGSTLVPGWDKPSSSIIVDGLEIDQTFVPSDSTMVGSQSITEFIDWGIANYPAQKYMLVFYNHGMATRGYGWDQTLDDQSSLSDIENGISSSAFVSGGGKFEIVGFDACLMACFESMGALRDVGKYYVASEEEEPWNAWDWTAIISGMNNNPSLDGVGVGKIIVDGFLAQSEAVNSKAITLSVVDLAKIADLETSLNTLFSSLNDDIYLTSLIRARVDAEEYGKSVSPPDQSEDMVDIGDLVKHLSEREGDITTEIDDVLAKIEEAVVYERHDASRPLATGISMFLPLNKLVNDADARSFVTTYYNPIDISDDFKSFVSDRYLNYALSDNSPVSGIIDNSFNNLTEPGPDGVENKLLDGVYSAIQVTDHEDIDHVQVVLMEEIAGDPDEYILLGSAYSDTTAVNMDGSKTFAYQWDEEWLGLGGFPAYIADIQSIDVTEDSSFTRVHIPAILNPGTEDVREIHMSFVFDEAFNHELEGIFRENYGDSVSVTPKDRVLLQPGDQVQLVYEIFDVETHEGYFVPEPGALITIENGNEDLDLQHVRLGVGSYHLGFVLLDHAQNDTLIYDPTVHQVILDNTSNLTEASLQVTLSPNPTSGLFQISMEEQVTGTLDLYDSRGRQLIHRSIRDAVEAQMDISNFPSGTYWLHLYNGEGVLTKKVIKP